MDEMRFNERYKAQVRGEGRRLRKAQEGSVRPLITLQDSEAVVAVTRLEQFHNSIRMRSQR